MYKLLSNMYTDKSNEYEEPKSTEFWRLGRAYHYLSFNLEKEERLNQTKVSIGSGEREVLTQWLTRFDEAWVSYQAQERCTQTVKDEMEELSNLWANEPLETTKQLYSIRAFQIKGSCESKIEEGVRPSLWTDEISLFNNGLGRYQEARSYYDKGEYGSAARKFTEAIAGFEQPQNSPTSKVSHYIPGIAQATFELGNAQLMLGSPITGINYYSETLRFSPITMSDKVRQAAIWHNFALAYLGLERYEDSGKSAQNALQQFELLHNYDIEIVSTRLINGLSILLAGKMSNGIKELSDLKVLKMMNIEEKWQEHLQGDIEFTVGMLHLSDQEYVDASQRFQRAKEIYTIFPERENVFSLIQEYIDFAKDRKENDSPQLPWIQYVTLVVSTVCFVMLLLKIDEFGACIKKLTGKLYSRITRK